MTISDGGLKYFLANPTVYRLSQSIMGAHRLRTRFTEKYIRPLSGMTVLDIGCGPADILGYLPEVDYWGFDISNQYIERARAKWGSKGKFYCRELQRDDLQKLPKFDRVLGLGLLHHLDDETALKLLDLVRHALTPEGVLTTFDGCLDPEQGMFARLLLRNDRGMYVRDKSGYEALIKQQFSKFDITVEHSLWLPYTRCMVQATR